MGFPKNLTDYSVCNCSLTNRCQNFKPWGFQLVVIRYLLLSLLPFLFPISFYVYLTFTVNKNLYYWLCYMSSSAAKFGQRDDSNYLNDQIMTLTHRIVLHCIILADNGWSNLAKIENCLEISSISLYFVPSRSAFCLRPTKDLRNSSVLSFPCMFSILDSALNQILFRIASHRSEKCLLRHPYIIPKGEYQSRRCKKVNFQRCSPCFLWFLG